MEILMNFISNIMLLIKILDDFPIYFISFLNQFVSVTAEEVFLLEKIIQRYQIEKQTYR